MNGIVLDAKTGLPVKDVAIRLNNPARSAVSKHNGSFSLLSDSVFANSSLTFSHLSYQTFTLKIKPGQTNFQVKLQPQYNIISEVTITALKKLKPEKIRPETVVDYALRGNQVFVLAWESGQQKPSLLVLDQQTNTLQLHYRLPFYTESLFVDCLDNLHLLTEDKTYQVYSDTGSFKLYPPDAKADFELMLRPCVAANSTNLYFRQNINKGIITSFYSANKLSRQSKLLRTVQDEVVLGASSAST